MSSTPPRRTLWLRNDNGMAHDIPGHPERPERTRVLERHMAANDWCGAEVREAPPAERALLETIHPAGYLDGLEAFCERGGGRIDADTSALAATWPAALCAAGGASALVDALLSGEASTGVSALRPPGHHAEPAQAMGFCFLGNVAAGARRATTAHGVERVLILDWDVHHGNGTQAIFEAAPDVLLCSIHQSPLYPGTGAADEVGTGDGSGFTVNLPVPGGTGDDGFRSLVEHVACGIVRTWEPGLVLISAGFDAHRDDPLATCRVTDAGFAGMAASVRRAAEAVGAPVGVVLEGGYDAHALARSLGLVTEVLAAPDAPDPGTVARHPLTDAAASRLAPWWPGL